MPDPETIRLSVRSYLQPLLPEGTVVHDDTPLVTSGLIDSIGLAALASHLENDYSLSIPEADFEVNNFDTLNAIVSLVNRLKTSA